VDCREFVRIRKKLDKTQKQLAKLLGISEKAVQSIEQGWRNISVQTERHLLFLDYLNSPQARSRQPCWVLRKCPAEIMTNCPAWEFNAGQFCWFVNGTICHGEAQESWKKKLALCEQCEVFPLKH
jgi:DNA-binding XRE family transcriptional regulator